VTCRLFETQLSSYLDGELPAARAARLKAHLQVCPRCQSELNAMSGIADRIRAASSEVEVSQDFDQRVLRSVGYWQVTGRPVRRRSLERRLLVVATVLLALLGGVRYYLSLPYRPPVPAPQPAAVVAPVAPGGPIVPDQERR